MAAISGGGDGVANSSAERGGWRLMACGVMVVLTYLVAAVVSALGCSSLSGCPVVWLPSGVGLAAFLVWGVRILPAVVAGAVVACLWSLHVYDLALEGWVLGAALIGMALATVSGSSIGAFLVVRWSAWPIGLWSERGAARFYVLGGVVSGLVGGAVVTAFWIRLELVPVSGGFYFFVDQILARILGTSVLAPLLLLYSKAQRHLKGPPIIPIIVPWVLALVAVLAVLAYVSASSIRRLRTDFQKVAGRSFSAIEQSASSHLESLNSIRSLWDSSNVVEPGEFGVFVERSLRRNRGLEALIWAPEILAGDREKLVEWLGSGDEIPAVAADRFTGSGDALAGAEGSGIEDGVPHLPVVYLEPFEKWNLTGFDLSKVGAIAELVGLSRGKQEPRFTRPFRWMGGTKVAALQWIDRAAPGGSDSEGEWIYDRPGFAVAMLDFNAIIEGVIDDEGERLFEVVLSAPLSGGESGEPSRGIAFTESKLPPVERGVMAFERHDSRLAFGGRNWKISALALQPTLAVSPPWAVVTAQAATLVVVTLLGILLMSATGRASRISEEVKLRTSELAEAEERFRQLAENIDEAFWIASADGEVIEYLSPGFERIWGRALADIEREPYLWRESVHPDDRSRFRRVFQSDSVRKGFDLEYRIVRPDGAIRWIRDRGFPVCDENGEVIRIAGVADDMTEQKAVEDGLVAAKRMAEEASEIQEQFFRVSLDLLCLAGTDGFFKRINPAFSETLGYSEEELLARPFVDFVHPDDIEDTLAAVGQLAAGETLIRFQNRYRHSSGHFVWLEWSAVPDSKGELIYAAARDVTERKKMEDELRRSNAELEQFAYVASHDLQEPLRMVTSFVQLLQRRYGGKLDEDADEYIRHVVDGTERMRRLIHGLLELSRVERLGRPLEDIVSRDALDAALENLGVAIEESGAEIEKGELPRVMADREQLACVFQNLIGNAIKFTRAGAPEISVGAEKEDGSWVFSVADQGPGIAPDYRERIFQIFQRLQTQDEVSGTGIGLTICRRIIDRHGGKIWVENGETGGATFKFTLPAA